MSREGSPLVRLQSRKYSDGSRSLSSVGTTTTHADARLAGQPLDRWIHRSEHDLPRGTNPPSGNALRSTVRGGSKARTPPPTHGDRIETMQAAVELQVRNSLHSKNGVEFNRESSEKRRLRGSSTPRERAPGRRDSVTMEAAARSPTTGTSPPSGPTVRPPNGQRSMRASRRSFNRYSWRSVAAGGSETSKEQISASTSSNWVFVRRTS